MKQISVVLVGILFVLNSSAWASEIINQTCSKEKLNPDEFHYWPSGPSVVKGSLETFVFHNPSEDSAVKSVRKTVRTYLDGSQMTFYSFEKNGVHHICEFYNTQKPPKLRKTKYANPGEKLYI